MLRSFFLTIGVALLPGCLYQKPLVLTKAKTDNVSIAIHRRHYNPSENVSIYYPEVVGLQDPEIQSKINAQFKKSFGVANDVVCADINAGQTEWDIENLDDEAQPVMIQNSDFEYQLHNKVIMITRNLFVCEEGMPCGLSFIETHYINCTNGQTYTLKDLFKSEESLIALQSLLQPKFEAKSDEYSYWVKEVPAISGDQLFYICQDGIELLFEPYAIAHGSNVYPSFLVPWQEMDGILNKDSHFFKSIQMIS